jgi:uncharacterized protein (DUF1684 family)
MRIISVFLAVIWALVGCGTQKPAGEDLSTGVEIVDKGDSEWQATVVEHRREKDIEFRSSTTSPMAAAVYLISEPGDLVFLKRENGKFGLAYAPSAGEALLQMRKESDAWYWYEAGAEVQCELNDKPLPSGAPLEAGVKFMVDEYTVLFYPKEDHITMMVFDPTREELASFSGLRYFEPDPSYAVEARLVLLDDPEPVRMLTSRNLEKVFYRYALLEFELEGKPQALTAYKYELDGEGASTLFIPFRDGTTGEETYGAGRFLQIAEPDEEQFVLDFNFCFNPLCNYSTAYNCPIPPRENHLEAPIRAGELTYPH